jgi:hypothetical protein
VRLASLREGSADGIGSQYRDVGED